MSFQTVKLRYIVEQELDNQQLEHKELFWPNVYGTLGLDDYPMWDSEKGVITYEDCMNRTRLNNKLIRHFYMRDIGLETIGLFRWYLRDAMHYVMPGFNPLYESIQYLIDPLKEYEEFINDVEATDKTENREHSRSGTRDGESVFSNTPENMLDTGDVANKRYATTLNYDSSTDSDSGTETSRGKNDRDYSRERHGHNQSRMQLVKEYRNALWNIDAQILESPQIVNCFMLVMG